MQIGFDFWSLPVWILMACVGIVIIPLILGGNLVIKAKQHEWYFMAGLLTLMPIVTGPIWLFSIWAFSLRTSESFIDYSLLVEALVAILPGVVLTFIIAVRFRRLFGGPIAHAAWILLILGCARWLNSFLIGATRASRSDSTLFLMLGTLLPTVFAIVAIYLSNEVKWTCTRERSLQAPVRRRRISRHVSSPR